VAQSLGKPPDAVSHFGEALRLEPENARFRFGLATAQIDLDDPDVQARAVQVIEEFRSQPEYRRRAYRALIQNHFRHERWKEGFLLAADLQAVPGAPFEDRMLLLDLLRKFNRPEFHAYLMDVQTAASRDPEHTAALIAWLNRNTMALIATDWGKSLPEEIRARNPVPSALAESYANLHNWPRLKTLVESGNWEQSDFMRSALYSRALREEGDLLVAKTQWLAAVNAARGRPDALAQLARFADACRWDAEAVDLLWQVARGKTDQQWALSELERKFGERRNARGLLNVATQRLELNPKDTAAQNNVAALSFLLNTNLDRAQILAREAYQAQPGNPATVATRAYALHLLGKTEEGLGLMRTLGEAQLQSPALAATYGILLVESPDSAEAVRFLEIAQGANLLPEEAALVADARSRLSRKASDKR